VAANTHTHGTMATPKGQTWSPAKSAERDPMTMTVEIQATADEANRFMQVGSLPEKDESHDAV